MDLVRHPVKGYDLVAAGDHEVPDVCVRILDIGLNEVTDCDRDLVGRLDAAIVGIPGDIRIRDGWIRLDRDDDARDRGRVGQRV